jgi:hypothetical protein
MVCSAKAKAFKNFRPSKAKISGNWDLAFHVTQRQGSSDDEMPAIPVPRALDGRSTSIFLHRSVSESLKETRWCQLVGVCAPSFQQIRLSYDARTECAQHVPRRTRSGSLRHPLLSPRCETVWELILSIGDDGVGPPAAVHRHLHHVGGPVSSSLWSESLATSRSPLFARAGPSINPSALTFPPTVLTNTSPSAPHTSLVDVDSSYHYLGLGLSNLCLYNTHRPLSSTRFGLPQLMLVL